MKIFGSDGFRSEFGTKYMTESFLSKFSKSFAEFCHEQQSLSSVVIGRDTRDSGNIIESIVSGVLSENGIDVTILGLISTPGLAYITKNSNFSYGIMITASHNPASDNGIKIFSSNGYKLDSNSEKIIEDLINSPVRSSSFKSKSIITGSELVYNYVNYIKDLHLSQFSKTKYLIDCSNGSNSQICNNLFADNTNIKLICCDTQENNINLNCGALESKLLHERTIENNCDYGIAFDGDGDRAIFCHKEYGSIPTEKIIALFARMMTQKTNNRSSIVSTEICNMGLKENLSEIDLELIETELGDRIVVNKVLDTNSILGAETSGHYFFPENSTTMDGLLAFLKFVDIIENSNISPIDYIGKLKHYNVIKTNIPVKEGLDVKVLKSRLRKEILPNEKIVLRESMWDPVIRVYYNYNKLNRFSILEKIINEE